MGPIIRVGEESFDSSIDHISFASPHIENMDELKQLRLFAKLRSASFSGTNLDDVGLEHVSHVPTLENLNLQETRITNVGLGCLHRLPSLQCLRLKDNLQLNNACIPQLLRLGTLVELQIHETSIDQHGLKELERMKSLRSICLSVCAENYPFDMLLALSTRMPACTILAKGHGDFFQGNFDGIWNGR